MAQTTHVRIGDGNTYCGNITGSFNKTVYMSDEDVQIMRWLSPLEPNNRHQGVRNDRFDGVGDWLLETGEFREWRGGKGGVDKAVLFCSGNPGVGKTYLSSLVIDSLCDQARKEDIAVVGLYCDFLAQQEQTTTNMMGAILKQLVGRDDIPNYLHEAFQESKTELGGRGLRLPDLMGMLKIALTSLPQVFICIDALDECLPKHLPKLLESLREIVRECPRTRIFLTGRPHVWEDIQRCFTKAIVVPVSPNADDIRSYLEMRLAGDTEPEAMNDELRADIMKIIPERISDIFLLISLNMDAILGEVTIRQRRKKLGEMTKGNGLSDAYKTTLTRLKAQKGNKSALGLKVLMWVLYSERPLRAEELCHALGVEIGSADLDVENLPALRTLVASCLGLVVVEASSFTVRLVHYTLQEHLSSDPTLFPNPHSAIAEICLTYLNFGYVRGISPTLRSPPSTTPLLEYASHYWGEHIKKGMTEDVKVLALRLLDRFDEHICAQLMLVRYDRDSLWGPYFYGARGPAGFTGLHGVAFLGIAGIVPALLGMREWDVNATDSMGCTALMWAAVGGHEEVVKVLLEQADINPDTADTLHGRTPLSWAADGGHEEIVKILLERGGVNPDMADAEYGRTPLLWAAGRGREGVVKLLLQRGDVNPNMADTKYGRTPLLWAAVGGHEGVVKMLLQRGDVNPDQVDIRHGQTPLLWAAERGDERLVKLLLQRGNVNPNTADTKCGQMPLLWAAAGGHEGVVKMLLERKDINPDQANIISGRTLLSWAAEKGYEGVVKILLQRGDVDPDQADTKSGRTPILLAAEKGHEGIIKILLQREDVNPNTADTYSGRTPLLWAAERGDEGVVKALLERGDVNPDRADTISGRTPISWAAEGGHEGVVRMLLEREGVNPDTADTEYGRTPVSWAAQYGYQRVVELLLKREDVNPNTIDTKSGLTPLSWAAKHGYEGVVRMLLERQDINPNMADTAYGLTPLSWAAKHGHKGVVEMLLARRSVNPDQADPKCGRTPLSWAAIYGHDGVVKVLLEHVGVHPDTADTEYRRTPLLWASERGYESVVKMLLEREDVNPDRADTEYGRTPLSWAAMRGHEAVVRILLGRNGVRAATPDYQNQTPLSLALSDGHASVAEILHARDNADPITEYRVGQLALQSTHPDGSERVFGREDSFPYPADGSLFATEPVRLSQPSSVRPPKAWYREKWNKWTSR